MIVRDVMELLDRIAPPENAKAWDHVGLQLGSLDSEVTRILIGLDLDQALIEEALAFGAQMIITHHPLIFTPTDAVTNGNRVGGLLLQLAERRIAFACAHTNLDKTMVGPALAEALGLQDIRVSEINPFMYTGVPKGVLPEQIGTWVKSRLGTPCVRICGSLPETVRKVAVVGGAGGDMMADAAECGADVYVTGEIKYHEAQEADFYGICAVEAGHDYTERTVLEPLASALQSLANQLKYNLDFMCSRTDHSVYLYL